MEYAEIVLKYIATLIYPFLIGAAILLFRKEISGILRGDFKAKYKDLELTIERNHRNIENIRKTQEVVIPKIKEEIEKLEKDSTREPIVHDLKLLLKAMEESLNYWENEIMRILRENDGKYSEEGLINYYFEVEDDPWHRSRDENFLRDAITSLLQKSFIMKKNGNLELHNLLMKKKA